MSEDNSQIRTSIDNNENIFSLLAKTDDQFANEFEASDGEGKGKNEILNSIDNSYELGRDGQRKSLYNRFFSKMEAGSVRGSVFAMSSLALGTGCLSLPLRFSQLSFVAAIIMLILGALIVYWSLTIMIEASRKSDSDSKDYSRLVKNTLGNGMALMLDIVILVYIFGILISYQVMSNK